MSVSLQRPSISIVTPSYNQGAFLRATIESVLNQGYSNLEYVIMDGGSTDGSVDIIKEYADKITHWESGPDGGHYPALNKGFAKTTGEIMAWINSDDMYTPWAFSVVSEIFSKFPEIEWLTTAFPLIWDSAERAVNIMVVQSSGYARQGFLCGENMPWGNRRFTTNVIQQESTFWRRRLWERAGSKLDESLRLAGDFELWANFFQYTELYTVQTALGGFRMHGNQKTANFMDDYIRHYPE
jgi:glycosyltransferase involved in cell wall biosynthesis